MNNILRITAGLALLSILSGCASSLPLISHAHIGHSLSAWPDTPGEQGLFVVAEREAEVAQQHASLAVQSGTNIEGAKMHTQHVVHAVAPETLPDSFQGPGLGYGLRDALEKAVDHIVFAGSSEDASQNVATSAVDISSAAGPILEQCDLIVGLAELIEESNSPDEVAALAEEIQGATNVIINGGPGGNPQGLAQLRDRMSQMVASETSPPYTPVPRRYLFALVPLPNGNWTYKFDQSGRGDGGY
jgi:hypothetical protein